VADHVKNTMFVELSYKRTLVRIRHVQILVHGIEELALVVYWILPYAGG
jgi:hypothetical protein